MPYVDKKLLSGVPFHRSGRPLLAFAVIRLKSQSGSLGCEWGSRREEKAQIPYRAPSMEMVQFLLDKGGDPNEVDGKLTIWTNFLISMYTLATIPESHFYTHTKDWFEVTRLLIERGADAQVECTVSVSTGTLARRVNLKPNDSRNKMTCSSLEIIQLVFGGYSGYDATELEDLLEQKLPRLTHNAHDMSKPTLQFSGNANEQDAITRSRTASGSSQVSQLSAASWRRPLDQDVIVPSQTVHLSQTQQAAAPSVPMTPQKQKKYLGLEKWFHKKKSRASPIVVYNNS